MKLTMKSILLFAGIVCLKTFAVTEINPNVFFDTKAQEMVEVIRSNQSLYASDPEMFKNKIKIIFEPLVDFRRVGASVMGRKYYHASTKAQKQRFIETFKKSLLNNYSSTLAQWGDQSIKTIFPDKTVFKKTENVHQNLLTSNNKYPIKYIVRNDGSGNWLIINIIVNGVNLGSNFRNHFQALAIEHNGDIEKVINNWTSDANL